ncbi:hypothetical protein G7062_00745 [Erysipelothrix sp. HDW6C]|uniref:hypothetical protein n=1 Tax=Erysipelothrix sp. HDW6C TaxID=2714930 RepID=UPI0014084855|nr:hypothetical protein [Erysipelothrix sp. HDW6C]QIK68901.1 hypothetical protein G7062_00745 [Erysipelothrix sp. HDW6C]
MKKIVALLAVLVLLVGCTQTPPQPEPDPEPIKPTYEFLDFKLKGTAYQLPVKFSELAANGWEAESDIEQEMAPNTIVRNLYLRNGDNIIKVSFFNDASAPKMMAETLIGEIAAENRTFGSDVAVDIVVHDGITFATPIESVIEQLGEYTEESNDVFKDYIFQHTKFGKTTIKYHLDGQDGNESRWIEISNLRSTQN